MSITGKLATRPFCPCGKGLDGFTSTARPALPKPGDFTVCAYCARILIFGKGLSAFREAEAEDMRKLDSETAHALNKAKRLVMKLRQLH